MSSPGGFAIWMRDRLARKVSHQGLCGLEVGLAAEAHVNSRLATKEELLTDGPIGPTGSRMFTL